MPNTPSSTPIPMSATSDDQATSLNAVQPTPVSVNQFTPFPNLLSKYASYNPVLSLLVSSTANYNKMINTIQPSQKFNPNDWFVICKSGGVGQSNTSFSGGTSPYFPSDMYIDAATLTTIVGMSQENRGSNATDLELTIIEPYGMDFIEQLYDFSNNILKESNYCQIPYMLKIEFKGYLDDGTNETVANATKYIPIHLSSMDIKVNNLGAIYKIGAVAFNEIGNTEQYGRVPTTIQLGSLLALAKEANSQVNRFSSAATVEAQAAITLSSGTAAVSDALQGNGLMENITNSFVTALNNVQKQLLVDGVISIPDTYSITYAPVSSSNNGYINQARFLDLATLTQTKTPTTAKDQPMGAPQVEQNKPIDLFQYSQYIQNFVVNPTTGETPSGVTYTNDQIITFNTGSSILDCLNTLFINSNYIVVQINHYNEQVNKINQEAIGLNLSSGSPIPVDLANDIFQLNNTILDWFHIVPSITFGAYDPLRRIYSRTINYIISPYKIYNARSISAPNANPIADNRVVKEYDYIFTGKNTEILNFDLNFNNAFYTYAQFNHNTKGQATGAGLPADSQSAPIPSVLGTKSTPISNGQFTQFVGSSNKSPMGIGAQTPERNQAADVAATIYAVGEQIQLDLSIYGDPDYIRQDGIFFDPVSADAFVTVSASNPIQGIIFNSGEIYANVNFKIPQDINLNTGILDLGFEGSPTNYRRNVFSGQYRITTVVNKFDKALFTQQLNMYRFDDSHDQSIQIDKSTSAVIAVPDAKLQTYTDTVSGIKSALPPSPPSVSSIILQTITNLPLPPF